MKPKPASSRILLFIALVFGMVLIFALYAHQDPSQAAFLHSTPSPNPTNCPYSLKGAATELRITVQADGSWQGWGEVKDASSRKSEPKKLAAGSLSDLRSMVIENPCGVAALDRPMTLEISGRVRAGEVFSLVLPSNPSTGYVWEVEEMGSNAVLAVGETQMRQVVDRLGGMAAQSLTFWGLRSTQEVLRLHYRRPWQTDEQTAAVYQIESDDVGLAELADALSMAIPQRKDSSSTSESLPQVVGTPSPAELALTQDLPSSFNWCAQGKCTPIRNQGNCGSCWAFSTVGIFESKLLMVDNDNLDLSEQFLVSCNFEGYDCDGGWFAHPYHISKLGQLQNQAGAVLEAAFPYQAADVPCGGVYEHPHRAVSWSYVNPWVDIPSVAEIKQAIYTHGPLAAAVCVGTAFNNYRGGIFSTDEKAVCGSGKVNHGIILVGWDDAQGVWILRNSWGTYWGESGYMRIQYGISNVGLGANYLVYSPSSTATSPAPTTPSPTTPVPPAANSNVYLPLVVRPTQPIFLLPNGNFEQGRMVWQEYSEKGYEILYNINQTGNAAPPYEGGWAAWLGGAYDEISFIQQRVLIPMDAPTLIYWHWIDSEDRCGYDFAGVLINGTVVDVYPLCSQSNTHGWVAYTVDLSQYAGQTVTLQIRAETDGSNNSNLFVDQVAFQAGGVSSLIPPLKSAPVSFGTKAESGLPVLPSANPDWLSKVLQP